ncbi:helix-turn-helix domain-containing protein [Paenibacillus crassostreae]|uniref:XRE family transcriptional regulator n=1 Tax=Paenibacillus crassostreae TaxID=1763538 RepID=A0A167BD05_9BACL|nr:XRE family transcriptional regulator [Paenibacillus crassostreae]AOZ92953.1 XRE family transcriptional regulator [Paenibacillus crassostreae]OAB71958.1 XRE family transcriptional regulator [Paenibacillus crassostreae]
MNSMGDSIRKARKVKKLTLHDLSEAASISLSFLSEIERDKANPSMSVLKRIGNALQINFRDLLADDERSLVIRKNERKPLVQSEGSRISWYALSQGNGNKMGPLWGVLEEGGSSGEIGVGHSEGEEFTLVVSGKLEIVVGNDRYVLEEGDSIYYDATIPHRYKNIWKGETILLSVATPPF